MNWWKPQGSKKLSREELRKYERNQKVIEELNNCPNLRELIFEMREDCLRRITKLEGDKRTEEWGKISILNKILDLDKDRDWETF